MLIVITIIDEMICQELPDSVVVGSNSTRFPKHRLNTALFQSTFTLYSEIKQKILVVYNNYNVGIKLFKKYGSYFMPIFLTKFEILHAVLLNHCRLSAVSHTQQDRLRKSGNPVMRHFIPIKTLRISTYRRCQVAFHAECWKSTLRYGSLLE